MKKILLTLALAIIGFYSRAQNSFPVPSGNVGIGVSSPAFPLDMYGQLNVTGANNARQTLASFLQAGQSTLFIQGQWGGNDIGLSNGTLLFNNNGNIGFRAGNTIGNAHMLVTSSGNVGIGTTSPDERLVIYGNIKTILDPNFQSKNVVRILPIGVSGSSGAQNWAIRGVYQYGNGVNTNADGGDLDIIKSLNGNTVLGTNANGTALGNVGIGTSTPDAKLAVNGTIHTQEVKVDMLGWADYVFKPAYSLKPLSEVKSYIDQNQHLPEIPSEADVKKDGVNLGEMNKLLLKKVEELTLYLIEQNKQLQEQQKITQAQNQVNQTQQEQLDQLKQQINLLTQKKN